MKKNKNNLPFNVSTLCYMASISIFLIYLILDYNSSIEVNYFIRLLLIVISSMLILVGDNVYEDNYIFKLKDRKKMNKVSMIIIFIYYGVLLSNLVIFARHYTVSSYNLIPFKTLIPMIRYGSFYEVLINIFGNLFIFMPLEYFLIELFNIRTFKKNLIVSIIILIVIEVVQYIFKVGIYDIDDIILCVSGMMIFYIIYNKLFNKNKTSI